MLDERFGSTEATAPSEQIGPWRSQAFDMQLLPPAPPSASTEEGVPHASPLSLLFRAIGLVDRAPPVDVGAVGLADADADTAAVSAGGQRGGGSGGGGGALVAGDAELEGEGEGEAEVDALLEEGGVSAEDAAEAGVAAEGAAADTDALSKWQLQQIYRVTQVEPPACAAGPTTAASHAQPRRYALFALAPVAIATSLGAERTNGRAPSHLSCDGHRSGACPSKRRTRRQSSRVRCGTTSGRLSGGCGGASRGRHRR